MPKASTFALRLATQMIDSDTFPMLTNAGENVRLPVSEARSLVGPGWSSTVNAYNEVGITREIKIQAAIARAISTGATRVFIPTSMMPYDATAITFDTAIQMVCEGGAEWSAYDVLAYGAAADGVTDDLTAIVAARTAAIAAGRSLVFPAGTYGLSDTLNLGFSGLASYALGIVTFKILGTPAVPVLAVDSGGNTTSIRHVKVLGDFRVQGNATSTKGLYARGCHDSEIECTVIDGAGIAFHTLWCVLSRFRLSASANLQAFTSTPTAGLQVDESQAGSYTADSSFDVIIEGITGTGVYAKSCAGCTFSGTSEGNTGKGAVEDAGCYNNRFDNFWCEANTVSDAEMSGGNPLFTNCHMGSSGASALNVKAAGNALKIVGGFMRAVDMVGTDTLLVGVKLSDNASLGVQGSGSYKQIDCYEVDTNLAITERLPDVIGERGTFTPTFEGATTPGTQTYTDQVGTYQRVGKRVSFSIWVAISAKDVTTAGAMRVAGLPFARKSGGFDPVAIGLMDDIVFGGGYTQLVAYVDGGTTKIPLRTIGSLVAMDNVNAGDMGDDCRLMLSGTYEVA